MGRKVHPRDEEVLANGPKNLIALQYSDPEYRSTMEYP
jgi:hypothetical protein